MVVGVGISWTVSHASVSVIVGIVGRSGGTNQHACSSDGVSEVLDRSGCTGKLTDFCYGVTVEVRGGWAHGHTSSG
jgi:hypothetical protein